MATPAAIEHKRDPRFLPRERYGAFSDALYSIIATIGIVPLSFVDDDMIDETATELCELRIHCIRYENFSAITRRDIAHKIMEEKLPLVPLYFFSFFMVVSFWMRQSRVLSFAKDAVKEGDGMNNNKEHVKKATIFWSTYSILFVSMVPLAQSVMVAAKGNPGYGMLFYSLLLCFISWLNSGMRWSELSEYQPERNDTLVSIMTSLGMFNTLFISTLIFVVVAGPTDYNVYWCFTSFGLGPLFHKSASKYFDVGPDAHVRKAAKRADFPKERLEAFSDGVIGITATFVILEARPENELAIKYLKEDFPHLLATFSTIFIIMQMFWMSSHAILSQLESIPPLLLSLNIGFLSTLPLLIIGISFAESFPSINVGALCTIGVIFLASLNLLTVQLVATRANLLKHSSSSWGIIRGSVKPIVCVLFAIIFGAADAPGYLIFLFPLCCGVCFVVLSKLEIKSNMEIGIESRRDAREEELLANGI